MTAQLECLYTNIRSTGTKQDELETVVQIENYDTIAPTEMYLTATMLVEEMGGEGEVEVLISVIRN